MEYQSPLNENTPESPPNMPQEQESSPVTQKEQQPKRRSFRDMVNNQKQHVELKYDDVGKDKEEDEDVFVDMSSSMPEIKIAKKFFEQIHKEWQNAVGVLRERGKRVFKGRGRALGKTNNDNKKTGAVNESGNQPGAGNKH
ncbi:L-rhamnose isomerase [Striga asiatica]|uniref:L-rhamnose isomerase n=1 Tax=Striga asiatica TaxID=4170 RepID=A0A5A7QC33_STRAF|nr:L-rhamnose isomerase [Striga asiatica]